MLIHIYFFCRIIKDDKRGGANGSLGGTKETHVEEREGAKHSRNI